MNIKLLNKPVTKLKTGIYEVTDLEKGEYDGQAVLYDRLISNGLYNRLMWGNSPKNYSNFCLKALNNNNNNPIVDIGCGTLSFTYKAYAKHNKKEIFLCDLSLEMLKIGKIRIESICDNISSINFLRSNALHLPFKENSIQTALSFGLFHLFDEPASLVKEIQRILNPEGKLFLTSLCSDRKLSSSYLKMLHKKGHVAKPLYASEINTIIEKNGFNIIENQIIGGMNYVIGLKK